MFTNNEIFNYETQALHDSYFKANKLNITGRLLLDKPLKRDLKLYFA